MSLDTLLQKLKANAVDYKALAKHCVHLNEFMAPSDIKVIVGCKGRENYLTKTLEYLTQAANAQQELTINLVVVEHDNASHLAGLAQQFDAEYIFVDARHTNTGSEFSRCLAFNVGHIWTAPARYELHHDSDLIMKPDFFANLAPFVKDSVKWCQPYSDRRVKMLGARVTNEILNSSTPIDLDWVVDFQLFERGAAGGSVLVSYDAMNAVGGYDDGLYWGYAPEDSHFWTKLEALQGPVNTDYNPHRGYGHYCEKNTLYHLSHGQSHWGANQRILDMISIYSMFYVLPYEQKLAYIKFKAEQFARQMESK